MEGLAKGRDVENRVLQVAVLGTCFLYVFFQILDGDGLASLLGDQVGVVSVLVDLLCGVTRD